MEVCFYKHALFISLYILDGLFLCDWGVLPTLKAWLTPTRQRAYDKIATARVTKETI